MSIFTAWVWIGRVMMSMTSSTSITSINGVVFISTMTSSSPLAEPTFIAIAKTPACPLSALILRLGEKADLRHAGPLRVIYQAANGFEANVLVGANMHFRQRPAGIV